MRISLLIGQASGLCLFFIGLFSAFYLSTEMGQIELEYRLDHHPASLLWQMMDAGWFSIIVSFIGMTIYLAAVVRYRNPISS